MNTSPLAPPWPLIGRTAELADATDLLTAPGGRGVIIRGPAGAGATRLGHEVWESARKLGHPVIRAAATHASRSVALGALAPLLSPGPHGRLTLRTDRLRTAQSRGRRPVLFVDDIHLLDDESVGLLQPLLAAGEFLLIATATPESRQESAGAHLAQDLNPVPLEPLPWTAVQTLLERVLDGPVERRTARQLHRVSGGRPLYLRELVGGALNGQQLVRETGLWRITTPLAPPPRLVELVRFRLATLAPPSHAVLEHLSLCGPDRPALFPPDVLDTLREAGLLRIQGEGPQALADLTDPLYGEVLRTTATLHRKRTMLLARAELAAVPSGDGPAGAELLRSTLWRLDAAVGVPPEDLLQAVQLARDAHDFRAALRLVTALVDVRPDAQSYLLLGEFQHACGCPQQAEDALARALELATTPDERLLGVVLRTQNLAQGLLRIDEAFAVNHRELKGAPHGDSAAVLKANEAALWTLVGDVGRAHTLLEEVADGSSRSALMAAVPSVYCLSESGRPEDALAAADQHADRPDCARAASVAHPAMLRSARARTLAEAGRLDEAEDLAHQAYDHAVDTRAGTAQIRAATDLAWIAYLQGDMPRARYWFASVVSTSRDQGFLSGLWWGQAGRALVCAVTGDRAASDDAWAEADRMLPDHGRRPECRLVEAWRAAALGRYGDARELLSDGARTALRTGLVVLASHLLYDVARLGDAHGVHPQLTELAIRCPNPLIALRARTAGALAAHAGAELERCAEEADVMGARLMAAETWTAAAGAHGRAGSQRKAASCRARAERLAPLCGARTPGLAPQGVRDNLTDREMEIALLAARGLGNAQIADQLALSVRTVGNHLHRVYAKVGVRDRRVLGQALCPEPVPHDRRVDGPRDRRRQPVERRRPPIGRGYE
ncbi:LuxR C-terminal-related transcriptional regulator [Streptomyces sp. NPDC058685]|uniref:helix-turn-helix transcriptional regulator n=1 Tax=Streptomyces sp. NPDC058685 TaxID=3346598 RepID=UPI003646CE23